MRVVSISQGWVENTLAWKLLSMIFSLHCVYYIDANPEKNGIMVSRKIKRKKKWEKISWEFFMTFKWIHKLIKKIFFMLFMIDIEPVYSSSSLLLIIYWAYLFNFFILVFGQQKKLNEKFHFLTNNINNLNFFLLSSGQSDSAG